MTTLFISDLHLDASHPEIAGQFLEFLEHRGRDCRALYILGDLFEYWLGDDDPDPEKRAVIGALKGLSTNVPIFFIRGNRDFLVGQRFAADAGVTLLDDPHLTNIQGHNVLLSHGDLLCTDDHQYQRYRERVNKPWIKALLLAGPLSFRTWLANRGRKRSRRVSAGKSEVLMDVNQGAVEQMMQLHSVATLIHGHTHRPDIHEFTSSGETKTRIVLGDWYQQGSVLRWEDDGSFELESLARS